jgi:hypothetical protein
MVASTSTRFTVTLKPKAWEFRYVSGPRGLFSWEHEECRFLKSHPTKNLVETHVSLRPVGRGVPVLVRPSLTLQKRVGDVYLLPYGELAIKQLAKLYSDWWSSVETELTCVAEMPRNAPLKKQAVAVESACDKLGSSVTWMAAGALRSYLMQRCVVPEQTFTLDEFQINTAALNMLLDIVRTVEFRFSNVQEL